MRSTYESFSFIRNYVGHWKFVFLDSVVVQLTDDMDAGHSSETGKYINIKIIIKNHRFYLLLYIFRKQRTTLLLFRVRRRARAQWYRR